MFFTKIASFFMTILYAVSSAFAFIPANIWYKNEKYTVTDSETVLLDVALISDTHSDSSYFHDRSKMLRKAICGIAQTDCTPDAMVIAGDISNASDAKEYKMFQWTLKTFNKIPNIIPVTGNHDVRARDTYEEAKNNFCDFAAFCGVETDKTYYTTDIKGYRFIILGSENQVRVESELSPEQVSWFENQLKDALTTDKPVFIICHQALYHSHNVYYNPEAEKNWGLGEQSDEIEAIIREYVPSYNHPVFYISGHLHHSFNEYTMDTAFCENLYCVSLPSVTKTENGGLGMTLEVYDDNIILRARNYVEMEWLEDYRYVIPTDTVENQIKQCA